MSELMNLRKSGNDLRWNLFVSVSAAALLGCLASRQQAAAYEGADQPTVWIELGGQLERMGAGEQAFEPSFVATNIGAPYNVQSPLNAERPSRYSFGGEGKITLQPQGSDWKVSAGVRYGRANRVKHLHQQTSTRSREYFLYQSSTFLTQYLGYDPTYQTASRFSDGQAKYTESHTILDFSVGRDVGLGLFGKDSSSTLGLGVRYAQFGSKLSTTFHSVPDQYYYPVYAYKNLAHHQSYYAHAQISRSFHGIGPSLTWEASAPVLGNADAGQLNLDWGFNASVLFGRQKVLGSHNTTGRHFSGYAKNGASPPTAHYVRTIPIARSQNVVVPNLGGFAGVSFGFPNAKVSFGYRADFFFGAMDGGIDARKTYDRNFYGPFATVSIGLGG